MVKNERGGGNAKRQGRKHVINKKVELRKSENELEEYACVTTMYGNGLKVITEKGKEMFCVMRGKFTGKNRRQNNIMVGSWILIGLREWEKEQKNCDLLAVYDRDDKNELMSQPGLDLRILIKNTEKRDEEEEMEEEGFIFKEESKVEEEYKKIMEGTVEDRNITMEEDIDIGDL